MIEFLVVEDDISSTRTMAEYMGLVLPNIRLSFAENHAGAIARLDKAAEANNPYAGIVLDGYFPRQKGKLEEAQELWHEFAEEAVRRGYSQESIIVYSTDEGVLNRANQRGFTALSKSKPLSDLEIHFKDLARRYEQRR